MQVCTSLKTDNHASTPPLSFLQAGCPSCRPTNSVKALKANQNKCRKARVFCLTRQLDSVYTSPFTRTAHLGRCTQPIPVQLANHNTQQKVANHGTDYKDTAGGQQGHSVCGLPYNSREIISWSWRDPGCYLLLIQSNLPKCIPLKWITL